MDVEELQDGTVSETDIADDAGTAEEQDEQNSPESDDPLEGREGLQKALLDLYLECCAEDRYPRLIEVKDVKQAEYYWQGRQYIWWSNQDKQWSLPTQAQSANYGDLNLDDMPRYEYVTNIYQARGLMMIGAVAGAPPRIRFFPEDADDENDLETAEGRTKLAKQIERWNPPQKLLQEETYHAWTGGFIAEWTRFLPDGEKYGYDSMPTVGQASVDMDSTLQCPECGWSAPADQAAPPVPCPQCGTTLTEQNINDESPISVPQDGEDAAIPKGRQVIEVFGALNCKRPQHTSHQSEWHYFGIEREVHYSILRYHHEDKAEEIKPGMMFGADDMFERNARLAVAENTRTMNQSGSAQAKLVTEANVWFRPVAFWMCKDKQAREELSEIFPRGCYVKFGGTTYLTSKQQSMDDAIASCHAMPGRGQHRPAVGASMISVQDRANTLSNISMETYEYGIPITYRDAETFSSEADDDQRAAPGLEIEVILPQGQDIRQKIMQVRADSVSPDMQKHMMDLMGPVSDEVSGTYPALSGAGEGAPDTLGQQAMQRDQAMGRMGIFYVNLKQLRADITTLACREYERNASGIVKVPILGQSGDFESEAVDISALEGEAEAYPEGDENFPELWNQQRATLMQIMDTPWGAKLAQEPGNAELFGKLTGISGLKIPDLNAWRKQLKEIQELTRIPEGDDMLAGIAPMVEVDPDDFHDVEAACVKWWKSSDVGLKVKRENPVGFQAVTEHGNQHKAAMPKPTPPEKPLSETLSAAFKDMPPEAQAQVLEKWGIHVSPQDFMDGLILKKAAEKPKPPAPGMPHPAGTQVPPAAGVQQ